MINNIRRDEILIEGYKTDFQRSTGRAIKVIVCNQWESLSNFTTKGNFYAIVKLIFDYTGWEWHTTYLPIFYTKSKRPDKTTTQSAEQVSRRAIIDYIAVNNGVTMTYICGETFRSNHTTILHSVRSYETLLETDYYTQKYFREIINYVKENYHMYKDRTTLKQEIIGGG